MPPTSAEKPPAPLVLRVLFWAWLGFQGLLLVFILATHGTGMEPDLRLVSGAAMAFASFPLSLLSMFAALAGLEKLASQNLLFNALVNWASCFLAGVFEWWLLDKLVGRFRAPRVTGPAEEQRK